MLCLVFFLLFAGAWYAQANVEDLELAIGPQAIGKWNAFLHLATTYDGRYSTNFLHGFNPLVWGYVRGYKIMIFGALFALLLASYWFTTSWLEIKTKWFKVLLSILFAFSLFLLSPNLAHHLYWMGSSFVYFYPCIFFLLFASALIQYLKSSEKQQFKWFILSAIILFIGLGFSELFLAFYLMFFAGVFLYLALRKRVLLARFAPLVLWGLIIIVFVLATPAVRFRFETDPSESALSMAILYEAIGDYWFIMQSTFVSWPNLFLLLAGTLLHSSNQVAMKFKVDVKTLLYFIGIFFVVPFLMTAPFFLVKISSDEFPYRIFIPTIFIQQLIMLFVFIPFCVEKLKERKLAWKQLFIPIGAIAVSLLLLVNIYFGNKSMGLLYSDYSGGKLSSFNTFMNKRYDLLKAEGEKDIPYIYVCVEELTDYPASIYTHPDLENDRRRSKWNKFIEAYFKIDQVAVPGDHKQKFDL